MKRAKVFLVGAGPGDPELITVKGRRVLGLADVVLYDHLANDSLLALAPAHAERIYVGKKKSAHSHSQEEICAMIIEHARAGRTVVRLKGGDPFIFGRGGEEVEAIAEAGLSLRSRPRGYGATRHCRIYRRPTHPSRAYVGCDLRHRTQSGHGRLEKVRYIRDPGDFHGPALRR